MDKDIRASELVAVDEQVKSAGMICWWRLSGVVDAAKLSASWATSSLPEEWLPATPTPVVALQRAAREEATTIGNVRRLLRPVRGGLALVDESENAAGELAYVEAFRVAVDKIGRLSVSPATHTRREIVESNFERALGELAPQDMPAWFTRILDRLDAVALRPTGGVYFVPSRSVGRWSAIVEAIEVSSAHKIYNIPALRTDRAIEAISAAVAEDAQGEIEKIEFALASAELGARALENRVALSARIEAKVVEYEAFLGLQVAGVHDRLEKLRSSLSAALLTANAIRKEEAAAAAAE